MEAVEWIDSGLHIDEGWSTLEVYKSLARAWHGKVTTVGFPIYEDDQVLVIALSRDDESDHYFGGQLIAKSSINSRQKLTGVPNDR